MKKIIFYTLFCATSLFWGCIGRDPCGKECGSNGTCLEGICICGEGYYGNICDSVAIRKYIGHFVGVETSSSFATKNIDWRITELANVKGQIQLLDNRILPMSNLEPTTFEVTLPVFMLDTANIRLQLNAKLNKTLDTIRYQAYYMSAYPTYAGYGVMVRQSKRLFSKYNIP